MEDGSAFVGVSTIRIIREEGHEVAGALSEVDGETTFAHVLPGTYTVEASAPGFVAVRQKAQIESGNRHPGKEVDTPIDEVDSATFRHNGPADSIKADANFIKEGTLDLAPQSNTAALKP
jgi:hypothetical protein